MKRGLTIFLVIILMALAIFPLVSCGVDFNLPDGVGITVMSYNIRQDTATDTGVRDWDARKEYLIEHVLEQAPSILCMQEVKKNQAQDIEEALTGYETIWYSRSEDQSEEGLAISYLSESFELVDQDMFWLSETPSRESKGYGAWFLRICVHAILREKTTNKEISVYCVHLEVMSEKARTKEIELVLSRIEENDEGREVIVCGDFNTTADSTCYQTIAAKLDSAEDKAMVSEHGITYQDFGGKNLTFDSAIDYIFTSSGFFPVAFDILDKHKEIDGEAIYYSDHYAVKAGIILVQES